MVFYFTSCAHMSFLSFEELKEGASVVVVKDEPKECKKMGTIVGKIKSGNVMKAVNDSFNMARNIAFKNGANTLKYVFTNYYGPMPVQAVSVEFESFLCPNDFKRVSYLKESQKESTRISLKAANVLSPVNNNGHFMNNQTIHQNSFDGSQHLFMNTPPSMF